MNSQQSAKMSSLQEDQEISELQPTDSNDDFDVSLLLERPKKQVIISVYRFQQSSSKVCPLVKEETVN